MFTKTITIYNKKQEGRIDKWYRTVIEGVHYENVHGIKLGDRSIQTDSSTEIVIPILDGFIKPKAYQQSVEEGKWTLAPNDKVILGRVEHKPDVEITERTFDEHDDVRTIKSYDVVDYASDLSLNNITVVAK